MNPYPYLYLASQSPRRQQLLQQIGLPCQLLAPDSAEAESAEALESIQGSESPKRYVQRVTALKADSAVVRWADRGLPIAPILCADTTVALGKQILGKPHDEADAAHILRMLSGQEHRVLTAVTLVLPATRGRAERRWSAVDVSKVRMRELSRADIAAYVASGEPIGKAGAYAVQGRAAAFITHLSGSHTGVMGLPVHAVSALLAQAKIKIGP